VLSPVLVSEGLAAHQRQKTSRVHRAEVVFKDREPFGTGEMGRIQGPQSRRRSCARSCRHLGRDGDVDYGTLRPSPNCDAPIHQRVWRVLALKDSRPDKPVNPRDHPLQDGKNRSGFLGNPVLTLIIKRAVQAIQI
jgi:hypothetical protein